MARYRTIKPEFWTSEQVVDCSPNARLLFIGLWNFCDDQGIHPYSPKQIKMEVFPGDSFTPEHIQEFLNELISNDLIRTYHIENKKYLIVTGWHHQKIEKPSKKYPFPQLFDDHSTTNPRILDDPSGTERKGKERSRVERKSIGEGECEGKGTENGNGSKPAFLENLKGTIERVQLKYQDAHIQRQVMLFVENNIRNHPGAIMHCLESLLKAPGEIKAPRAYLEAAMKIENGKHNARDSENACNEFKKLPPNMSSFADIFKGMVKNG
jgi:hypothetical protein